eukprot:Lithocolla_globosa_v1_NODE_2523_length_1965_cov_5.573822.p3 type:complete len:118 gc:universal NODE_2523_length_1965_cov_5.573822:1197-844(-)
MIIPTMDYGAEILGYVGLDQVNLVHHRACRFFLGVPRKTANAAVEGELAWTLPAVRRQTAVIRYWTRLINLHPSNIPHQILNWNLKELSGKNRNWSYYANQILTKTGLITKSHSILK